MTVLNFNEFSKFMATNDFQYTVGIVIYLDMMALTARRIRRYRQQTKVEADAWINERLKEEQTIQEMAIELAYSEKTSGPMFERILHMLSGRQRKSINQSVKRMAPYLKRLGVELEAN